MLVTASSIRIFLQPRRHALVCVGVQLSCFTALVFFADWRPVGRVAFYGNGGDGGGERRRGRQGRRVDVFRWVLVVGQHGRRIFQGLFVPLASSTSPLELAREMFSAETRVFDPQKFSTPVTL